MSRGARAQWSVLVFTTPPKIHTLLQEEGQKLLLMLILCIYNCLIQLLILSKLPHVTVNISFI